MSCNCGEADECDGERAVYYPLQPGGMCVVRPCHKPFTVPAALSAPAAAPRPAPAEPQGAEAPQEIKSLRDRIIEGELELDGTHPPTLMFLMAEHWKAVATEHYAKAKDYDRLKHELRLSRTATAPQPAGGEREAFEAWCSKRGQDYERLGDGYTNDLVQRTWQGWQARADLSQPAAQAAEVEALRDELRLCCELKREYQEQVASKVDEVEALQTHNG